MDGFLLVDKPLDWTSFDVVNKVRGTIARDQGVRPKRVKVGHSGTLDPKATGLLVLAIGKGTKSLEQYLKLDKTYEATVQLGATSSSDDVDGEIIQKEGSLEPSKDSVLETLNTFVGEIEQVPPIFSAIKIDGRRAYSLARSGQQPVMKPRTVCIHSIKSVQYSWPELTFITEVGSGTYIRSLARDIGEKLEVGGYLTALRRTKVGNFSIADAINIDDLNIELIQSSLITLEDTP